MIRWWLYDRIVDLWYAGGWRTELARTIFATSIAGRWWLIP